MGFRVDSETGKLRRVIVHRPGLELSRLTPSNRFDLLFDDVLWAARAREEHDAFAQMLRDRGVEVHLYGQLLAEALSDAEAREWVFDRILNERTVGPSLVEPLRRLGRDVDSSTLARFLIGGIVKSDVTTNVNGVLWSSLDADDFLLSPLPNTLFPRDNSAWVYGGVTLNPMKKPARKRETIHTRAIYRWHPMFRDAWLTDDGFGVWVGSEDVPYGPATIEGGDVLVIGNRSVMIGLSERTSAQGLEILVRRMFDSGDVDTAIAVRLPKARAFMHLDTVMTMVDRDAFVAYPGLIESIRSYTVTPNGNDERMNVVENESLVSALATTLGLDQVRLLTARMDSREAEREQWDDGNNFLALSPGLVVGYERNVRTNAMLESHGVEVVPIAGNELGRGRGGPRCMSCPFDRAPVDV